MRPRHTAADSPAHRTAVVSSAPPAAAFLVLASFSLASLALAPRAFGADGPAAQAPAPSAQSSAWNVPQAPFKLFGNSYYVGPHGLSSVLITSDKGHVLIDGALPESAPKIAANIRALGFRVEDVKLILNSHVHFDHAGGIAQLQKMSGAKVMASERAAPSLRSGHAAPEDPQFQTLGPVPPIANVSVFKDGETLHVGALAITAHLTPGHTPGGTTWTWDSCEKERCLHMVYADSLSTASSPGFKFSNNTTNPNILKDFESSFARVSALPCDVLVSAHPELSDLWGRLEKRDVAHDPDGLIDSHACEKYVAKLREGMAKRVAEERAQ
jgi:metallo-beta-lactamase class B